MGEIPFLRLIRGEPLLNIPGLCYRQDAQIIIKEPFLPTAQEFQEIKSILNYSRYDEVYRRIKTFRNTRQLFTSFGCRFNCNFCSIPKLYNRQMLFRDMNLILDEVIALSKKTKRILFVDPDMNINKERFVALFSAIVTEKDNGNIPQNIKFVIQARLDCFDEEMLHIAKKANVLALIGVESLSQRIRDMDLNKGGKLAEMSENEVKQKIDWIRDYIGVYLYFILATPETKMTDLICNLNYLKSLKKGSFEVNIHVTPFFETNYFNRFKNTELIVWKDESTKKSPLWLKCKDKAVEHHIEKAFEAAKQKHIKHEALNFSNLFVKELMNSIGL